MDASGVEWIALLLLSAILVVMGLYPKLLLDPIDVATVEFLGKVLR